jgi:RNA polymerase sigma-70 factor (ECF subfamily)
MESTVSRFYAPLYRFALFLTKSEAEAVDLTQRTFFILARRSDQIRDVSKVKCWLFTTLRREFIRSVRLQSNHPHLELRPDIHDSPSVASYAERAQDAKFVVEALSRVEETYRIALELFYLGELSYQEIAQALQLPIDTVMSRLSRGKDQLKALLAVPISESETTISRYREMKGPQIEMTRGRQA